MENNTNTNKTTNTNKKEGKKTMKKPVAKINTVKTENKKTVPVTLSENIDNARKVLLGDMKIAIALLNAGTREHRNSTMIKVNSTLATLSKDCNTLNALLAQEYMTTHTVTDTIKAGAIIPSVRLNVDMEKGTIKLVDETVKPRLSLIRDYCPQGDVTVMVKGKATIKKQTIIEKTDALRRVSAYIVSGKEEYINGTDEDKINPVTAVIIKRGTSVKKAKELFYDCISDIIGTAVVKNSCDVMYKDFVKFIEKRGEKWGTRTVVGQSTVNDLLLEYVHMTLNGQGNFQFVIEK